MSILNNSKIQQRVTQNPKLNKKTAARAKKLETMHSNHADLNSDETGYSFLRTSITNRFERKAGYWGEIYVFQKATKFNWGTKKSVFPVWCSTLMQHISTKVVHEQVFKPEKPFCLRLSRFKPQLLRKKSVGLSIPRFQQPGNSNMN